MLVTEKHCPNLRINSTTDSRFRERLVPSHLPRSRGDGKAADSNAYQLFSLTPPRHEHFREMMMKGVPLHLATLMFNASKHDPLLSTLGILPNQLRVILKERTPKFNEAFDDISFTLFRHGYQIWKLRKSMMSIYWKEIAQNEWKIYPVKKKEIFYLTGTREMSFSIPLLRTSSKP